MQAHFGKIGAYYYWIARGIDNRLVCPDRIRKSLGTETTFFSDSTELSAIRNALQPILDKLWHCCAASGIRGRTVTLKVKFADFQIITRSRSVSLIVASRNELEWISLDLLRSLMPTTPKGVRLLGVTLSNLRLGRAGQQDQMILEL